MATKSTTKSTTDLVLFLFLAATLVACNGAPHATAPDGATLDVVTVDVVALDVVVPDVAGSDVAVADATAAADGSTDPVDAPGDSAVSPPDGPAPSVGLAIALTSASLNVLSLDAAGTLTERSAVPVAPTVVDFVSSPDHRFVYALGSTIQAYALDPVTGALTLINETASRLVNPTGITIDPTGRWLIASDRMLGVAVFAVRPDGGVGAATGPIVGGPYPTAGTFDPSGKLLFVPFCDTNLVVSYVLDSQTGALTAQAPSIQLPASSSPNHLAFHPLGHAAYTLNIGNQTVTSFDYTAASGVLSSPETVSILRSGQTGTSSFCHIHSLVVHPSGKFAYATTAESGGSVAIMSVAASGRLTVVGHELYFLFRGADPLAIDPTGAFLLVGNTSGRMQVFGINPADGSLTFVTNGLSSVDSLAFLSP